MSENKTFSIWWLCYPQKQMMGPDPIKKRPASISKQLLAKPRSWDGAANCNGEETAKINHNFPAGPPQKSSRSIWVYCAVAISWAGCNYSIYFRLYTTKIRALPFTTLIEQNWIYYSGNCSKLYISLPSFIIYYLCTLYSARPWRM